MKDIKRKNTRVNKGLKIIIENISTTQATVKMVQFNLSIKFQHLEQNVFIPVPMPVRMICGLTVNSLVK